MAPNCGCWEVGLSEIPKLTLFGSFGHGNVGDEAVPLAINDILSRAGRPHDIAVVGRWQQIPDESVIGLGDRYNGQLEALNGKPAVLSGGGVIEPRSIGCVSQFDVFRQKVTPSTSSLVAGSFEFGVTYGWRMKRQLRRALGEMEHIYTRDYVSELFFRQEFPEFEVTTTGDVVLAMQAADTTAFAGRVTGCIAVSLSKIWEDSPGWLDWTAKELLSLSDSLGKPLVFVPMSCAKSDDDRIVHKKVCAQLQDLKVRHEPLCIEEVLGPREIAAVFRDASLVISMRLHGCVMAYGQRTPFVALSYHPKLIGFAQTVGCRHFLLPRKIGVHQESGRYGISFDNGQFRKGELVSTAMDAMTHSSFDLLPLFNRDLTSAFVGALG